MAGAAIIKPAAVVINALEIESDKIEAPPSSPYKATRPNASIIPTTVPNKPINGASEAITERGYIRAKCVRISRAAMSPAVWLTASRPAFTCSKIKRSEFASVEGYLSQAANAPFKSPFAKHSLTLLHKGFGARRP